MLKKLSRYIPNRNLYIIVVLGPDGSGKSTLISNLMNEYKNLGNNYYAHLYPNLNSVQNSQRIYPYLKKPYSFINTILKIIYMILLNFINYIIIFFMKKGTTIVWCDRFLYDVIADPERYRISRQFMNLKFIKKMIIKPFLTIIINPPIESIYKRSKELSYDELLKLSNSYKKLYKYLPESLFINTNESPEQTLKICKKHIDTLFKNKKIL